MDSFSYVIHYHTSYILCSLLLASIHNNIMHIKDIQLENGCSGVLQTSSTGGNDSNYGSGSGEIPALIGVWTDVCSKEFGHKEAEVVCKQLQCGSEGKRVHPSRYIAIIVRFIVHST